MFDVHCPVHGSTVLLPTSRIRGMVNTDHGIVVEMECYDGARVTFVTGRGAEPRGELATA
jgi:hypothetical protein